MARFPWQKKKDDDRPVSAPTGGHSGQTLSPDHALFAADPGQYLIHHGCELTGAMKTEGMGDPIAYCFDVSSQTSRGRSYMPIASKRMSARLCVNPTTPTLKLIQVELTSQGKEFAFLPWEEDGCTALILPTTADYVVTGPLSGCHVYIAESPGKQPLLFHANANSTGSDLKKNIAGKDNDAMNLAGKLGYTLTKRVARGEYSGIAFVWGKRSGHHWSIYVHQAKLDGTFSNWPLSKV